MEHFSDFEWFLFSNGFVEDTGEKEDGYSRVFIKNPSLKKDKRRTYVDHSHLNENPIFVSGKDNDLAYKTPLPKKPRLSSLESFILNNDFVEETGGKVDHFHLFENPLIVEANDNTEERLYKCSLCKTQVRAPVDFLIHMSNCRRKQHRIPSYVRKKQRLSCKYCQFRAKTRAKLEYHEARLHRCTTCNYKGWNLARHKKTHGQQGGNASQMQVLPITANNPFKEIGAFKGFVRTYRESGAEDSLDGYFRKTRAFVKQLLSQSLKDLKVCKAQFSVYITFRRYLCKSESGKKIYEVLNKPMNSKMLAIMNSFGFDEAYDKWCQTISSNTTIFQQHGSGWVFSKVTGADLRIGKLLPQRGGCWLGVPNKISKKKAVINVKSSDNQCFKWAILAASHHKDLSSAERRDPNRPNIYKKYEKLYDFTELNFPVELSAIPVFEAKSNLAINVFSYDHEDGVLPVHISKYVYQNRKTVDLLLLTENENFHYAAITDIHKLLGKKNCHRRLLCYNCLNTFAQCKTLCNSKCCKKCKLNSHIENCIKFKYQRIQMPELAQDGSVPTIQFKNYEKQLRAGYVVYADFESLLIPVKNQTTMEELEPGSYTIKQQAHVPCGYAYVVVNSLGKTEEVNVYRGEDCVDKFLEDMKRIKTRMLEIYHNEAKAMKITNEEKMQFKAATECHICEEELGDDRVRDHDHLTGLYRGAAHQLCNLIFSQRDKLPVLIHNFRGYDSHLIISGFNKFGDDVQVIPTNYERFLSISADGIVFIDSLQFLNAKLETLVENLAKENDDRKNFPLLYEIFEDSAAIQLLKRKGVYPYDYYANWDVFSETCLPPIESFYNKLRDEQLPKDNYLHAVKVYDFFKLKNLGDYHDLYLLTDTILLASVFESFRNVSLKTYKLDPVHYISAPGLAWDAALRMTKVELDQLTDIDMYEFLEAGMRGGVSMIVKRSSEANNRYMSSYTGDEDSENQKYIVSWDMNNLYGIAMQQRLPVSNFRFLSEKEIEKLDISNLPDNSKNGYFFECDLDYDPSYHSLHNDYPLAPDKISIPAKNLSDYQKGLLNKLELKYNDEQTKLIPHLGPRRKYKVHYRNLKYYLENGMILKKVHRVLAFKQKAWLAPYINFNTSNRMNSKNRFESDFFKLMNNSVFGKGMENVRRRMSVRLVNKWNQAKRLIVKPQYITHDILCDNLCSFRMEHGIVRLNKAVYTGFAVLDLSKLYMYNFHYGYVKDKYNDRAELLFTDTDSLTYEIKTGDVYADMLESIDLFDTSDYPKTHFLHSVKNKKVIGKMHDEANGDIIFKFVGLAPKVYCLVIGEMDKAYEKKALKGVPKYIQEKNFTYKKYSDVLKEEERLYCKMKQIRSYKHKINTIEVCKSVLHGFDSKRWIADNGIDTLAWGHSNISYN